MLRKHHASYQYFPVYSPLDTFVETKFAFRGAKMFPNKFKNIFVAETTFPSLPAMRNSIAEILIVEDRMTHILTPYIWNSPRARKTRSPPRLKGEICKFAIKLSVVATKCDYIPCRSGRRL